MSYSLSFLARRLLAIVMVAAITGLFFGSTPLLIWTKHLPQSLFCQSEVQDVADYWNHTAKRLELTVPYDAVRKLERKVESYRFAPAPD